MASRGSPALAPASAFLVAALLAPRLVVAPSPVLLLLVTILGLGLRSMSGLAVAAFAGGLLRSETAWVGPLRASRGIDVGGSVLASFEPKEEWERRADEWTARGRVRWIGQDARRERVDLDVRAVVATEQAPAPAVSYRLRGSLRPPLAFYNPDALRTGGWQLRVKSARFVEAEEPVRSAGLAARARARLVAGLGGAAGGSHAGSDAPAADGVSDRGAGATFLEGLLLGRTAALPETWQRGLRRTGLMHLFAVSGLHVSLIAGLMWSAGKPWRPVVRATAALGVAGAYALLVGLQPSVVRSMLMLAAMIGARVLERPPSSLNALALSAWGIAAVTPALVYDLSFQLTVAATAGVVGLGPELARRWGGGPVATAVAVCVGAQLATVPITAPTFCLVPLAGAALNLIAVPWTGCCLVLGLLWAVIALLDPGWGAALLPCFDPLAAPFGWLAALPPHPVVSFPVAPGPGGAMLTAVSALAVLLAPPRAARAVAGCLGVAVLCAALLADHGDDLEATLLDVGQGDAMLLRDGAGSILVDGGGWPAGDFGGRVLLPALARLGVRSLDAIVVSHPDADHCAGLADLVSYLPVAELWIAPGWGGAPCLRRLLGSGPGTVRVHWRGDRVEWRRFQFDVLHPGPGESGAGNDRSLVLRASAGGRSLLLAGDVSERVETAMVRRRNLVAVDALKVAHHGSGTSTSLPFLASAAPGWGLISAGRRNAYGHPAEVVLRRLARKRVTVLRTDLHGRVRLRWRAGGPLRVETSRAPLFGLQPAARVRPGPPWLMTVEYGGR